MITFDELINPKNDWAQSWADDIAENCTDDDGPYWPGTLTIAHILRVAFRYGRLSAQPGNAGDVAPIGGEEKSSGDLAPRA